MDARRTRRRRGRHVRAVAETAEGCGLDSVWIADHLLAEMQDGTVHGMHDAWTLLSAVAAVTTRVELGPLVLCSSFRDPGVVAKMAATLDEVSDGRLVLGLGAGWHDPEYEAFGFPTDHRVSRFAEALEIIVRLLRGERVSFDGAVLQPLRGRAAAGSEALHPDPGRRPKATHAASDGALGRCLEHRVVCRAERQAARGGGGVRARARRHGAGRGRHPANTRDHRRRRAGRDRSRGGSTRGPSSASTMSSQASSPRPSEFVERLGSGVRLFRGA